MIFDHAQNALNMKEKRTMSLKELDQLLVQKINPDVTVLRFKIVDVDEGSMNLDIVYDVVFREGDKLWMNNRLSLKYPLNSDPWDDYVSDEGDEVHFTFKPAEEKQVTVTEYVELKEA